MAAGDRRRMRTAAAFAVASVAILCAMPRAAAGDNPDDQSDDGGFALPDAGRSSPSGTATLVPAPPAPGTQPKIGTALAPGERRLLSAPLPSSEPLPDEHVTGVPDPLPDVAFSVPVAEARPPATLVAALALAYESNPQILAERQRVREVDEDVPQALSGWRPHVSIDTLYGAAAQTTNIDPTHYPERRVPQQYDFRVVQPVYEGGGVRARLDRSKAEVNAARANLRSTEEAVLLAAGTAYLDVIRDREIVALQRNQQLVQARTQHASDIEVQSGAITPADYGQARARTASADADVDSAEAALSASDAQFQREVGEPPSPGPLSVPDDRLGGRPPGRAEALALTATDNPDIVAAGYRLAAAAHGIDVEKANLLPHVDLIGTIERVVDQPLQMFNQRSNDARGEVHVTWSLYQGGYEYSRVRQAKEMTFRLQYALDDTRRTAQALTATAWDRLVLAQRRLQAEQAAIDGDTLAVAGIAREQAVGARTLLDLLIVEQELLRSRVQRVIAMHDVLVARLELLADTGRLDSKHLALPLVPYDPAEHYREVHDEWIGLDPPR